MSNGRSTDPRREDERTTRRRSSSGSALALGLEYISTDSKRSRTVEEW